MIQLTLDGSEVPIEQAQRVRRGNPLIPIFGPGPEGTKCGDCTHLFLRAAAGHYLKCDLRRNTYGAATDHRARWPTCGRYQERR